ncbi:rhomboid family intramembrane serine protease [Brumimicrobium aurantiacum]|uniref:Rhomboid family intramembrane serine protease n=1 Tax=Brumimicrobium aurantiacum TaxID=1737063 RepID=A0A3E1EYW6_9FLAO|nr:rhomboid family intramembrane serine protease [Brumimicrobium aurantiacum]RFC54761.1 rhomboid family intramembrane serine protease [Brumimicrobium aurantiacum]
MNNLLGNMPPVVKNLLLLNVIMFIVTQLGEMQGIPMTYLLGGYVFNSPYFEPYQMVTHFFMHGGIFHIFFNMFALVVFGSALEQVWGPKRFFIFYVATAIGAFFLHQIVGYIEVAAIESDLIAAGYDLYNLQDNIAQLRDGSINTFNIIPGTNNLVQDYISGISVPVVGASGAVYGVLVGFGYLFPNTRLMLLFPPIPIKAKWLVMIMVGIAFYNSFQNNPGDNIAHLAHLGGAIVGFIIVLIWQKDKRKFY